ncbi:TonB-dependent receptor [Sphingomonas sp. Ag1]|jgi:outer membrane receptor protein involved in Fe transport|uniref:TonB-dependent receptor n=1 Tax=Sphingomonas sp. Ag1 TaxID=1642949 RepID=UPI00062131CF|nr:TonB-dependent receptor [Sphingomonas sp. Ag1]KKI18860.1 TonB-dependent receptor [Sphingomonas sp. Ag1]
MRRVASLLSTAAIFVALPALAQEQPSADPLAAGSVQQPQSAPAADTDLDQSQTGAGDIVVTATRRAERLADVPIAVSAVSQASLQNSGANDIRGVVQLAPSLLISSTGSEANASARIRGIGTVGDNPGLESSVAVFIDGVYRSRTGSGLNDIGEVDRIEVLRGPQGTLSGRNASAGAINVYTKAPSQTFGGYVEGTYGNYDNVRIAGAITGPVVEDVLSFRLDGVWNKRDGFYRDVVNDTDYNNRNRWFVRGQLLFEPTTDLSVRLIGDYTWRDEKCCGAVYVDLREKQAVPGQPGEVTINPAGNRIVDVLQSLGGVFPSAGDPYNRRIAFSPGRAYSNETKDYGGSMQIDYNFGNASLTSITAYREYKAGNAADIDYGNVDLGYRADDGRAFRQFHTFTQEVRLQGSLFDDRLDWLVGGFYSNEDLVIGDNLQFGSQYGAFAACRIVATVSPVAALRNPAAPGCLSPAGTATLSGAFGPIAGPALLNGLRTLSTLNNLGDRNARYYQDSENYAFFTHNIFKLTDTLSITAGLRWTHESKDFRANFDNNNTVCPQLQQGLGPLLANPATAALAGGIITLGCTGNSSTALNGLDLRNSFDESEFTGTGVISWKPTRDLMVYASYSRGYKAGGYNLDRSELAPNAFTPVTNAGAARLRFDPELVNSYEAGIKYATRQFTANLTVFRSDFENFQLNTFNGTNFVVQNIGSCSVSLNGADQDNSATTGACSGDVGPGVRSQGVELELGIYPARNFAVNLGYTLADTKFRRNLVGSASGEPLDPALFLLAGRQMSNAPRNVVTSSVSWTPEIGDSGLSALFYVDGRLSSDYNTGSDLFIEKEQDGFFVMNARIGLRGLDSNWAIEAFAQNLLNENYQQVAFNAPFQGAGSLAQVQRFGGVGNQIFSSFLAEPRTYGLTLRKRF